MVKENDEKHLKCIWW